MENRKCKLNIDKNGKELYPHGSIEFPCTIYKEIYEQVKCNLVPWHCHEEMELIYSKRGEMIVQSPKNSYVLHENELGVINANIPHHLFPSPTCELYSIVFKPSLIYGDENSVYYLKYLHALTTSPLQSVKLEIQEDKTLFLHAFYALENVKLGYEFSVRNDLSMLCFNLWHKFSNSSGEKETLDIDTIRISLMLKYIHENFGLEMHLKDIAKAGKIGERECMRCFNRTMHVSPVQYLLKYRIQYGAKLLIESPLDSISQITNQVGFDSPSNFSKMFKRFYKVTPKEYRMLYLKT